MSSLEYDEFGNLFALQSERVVDLSHLELRDDYSICTYVLSGLWSRFIPAQTQEFQYTDPTLEILYTSTH